MSSIRIRGAKTHNLQNIDLDIPRNQLVVFTGLSGSGKSSLAFDTLYAEGQRRYVESLSAYARQFLSMMEKPDVDLIEGLSPAISIEQKTVSHNPRSTVGTTTEIYDYLRVLYARVGQPHCPTHQLPLNAQTISNMVDACMALPQDARVMLLAPMRAHRKGEQQTLLEKCRSQGFIRARINGEVVEIDQPITLDAKKKHTIEIVIDRLKIKPGIEQRLAESFESAIALTGGLAIIDGLEPGTIDPLLFSAKFACPTCGYSIGELEPRLFSFNNPTGACQACDGLGTRRYFDPERVIINKKLSLDEGAVRGWDKQTTYYHQLLLGVANHYGFSLSTPWEDLDPDHQKIILYGSGNCAIEYFYSTRRGAARRRVRPFEGVIPSMERRYAESESDSVRQDLAKLLTHRDCDACQGTRLCEAARHVRVGEQTLPTISQLAISEALAYFKDLTLPNQSQEIAQGLILEITNRLQFLSDVGLNYLSLSRTAETLSGGESQRIRLASQIGSGLVGVLYILDEPTIGLHQRDSQRLIQTLTTLRDLGNTVIVVEHDLDTIMAADHLIDIGPKAGIYGGQVVAQGPLTALQAEPRSLTGQYLSGAREIAVPSQRTPYVPTQVIRLRGACCNNLKSVDVNFPIGLFTCVTGVSGSGKSSLINDTLHPIATTELNRATTLRPGSYRQITGLDQLDKVVTIDQSPIGRTPRSNPATYTGMFTPIRELFSNTPQARARGYLPGRFSFNVRGGRCEACEGDGLIRVEMHFLADVYVTCEACQGARYNRETLDVLYKGQSISDVLNMTIDQAFEFFSAIPMIARKCQTLIDVGLGYLTLGQSATTLSGGEAQRIKLSKELSKRATGRTLYILDEPSTGLHFHDIEHLLTVLHRLRDQGNTIVVIEHNLDVIKTADWIIDMGPEGGSGGGTVMAMGTPESVADCKDSYTGIELKALFQKIKPSSSS